MRPHVVNVRFYDLLENLFMVDSIAARIVTAPIETAFAQGWQLTSETDPDAASAWHEAAEQRYKLSEKIQQLLIDARLYGFAKLWLVTNGANDQPLAGLPTRVWTLWPVPPRDLTRHGEIRDVTDPAFGGAEHYLLRVTGAYAESPPTEVHASRLLTAVGSPLPKTLQRRHGVEGLSVLYRCLDKLKRYATAQAALATNVTQNGQPIYKIKNLMHVLDSSEGEAALRARFWLIDQVKSAINSVLLDSDGEEYERSQVDLSGVPESIDRIREDLSECSGIPITVLFGRSPAGLSATGESDLTIWYNHVQNYRSSYIEPLMAELIAQLAGDTQMPPLPKDWEIDWPQLDQPSAAELSKIRLETAQADAVYIQAGVFEPEAVAEVRSKPDGYQLEVPHDPEDGVSDNLALAVLSSLRSSKGALEENGQSTTNVPTPAESPASDVGSDRLREPGTASPSQPSDA